MLGVLFIAVFSFFLSGIFVPGLQSDEACDGLWAYYIINPHIPLKEIEEPTYFVTLFNRFFPVMANHPYIGAVESYLLVPFFLLFGVSVFSLRLMPVVISLVTVFLVYRLCKDWFGKKMAVMALLLTVTNLAFVMFSRVGLYREELFSIFFFWSGIFYFQKYITKQKIFYFCLGCFLFGLGISAKIIFLWYIIGTIFACAILGKIIFTHYKYP